MRPCYWVAGGIGSLGRKVVPRILARRDSAEIVLPVRARHDAELRARMDELGCYPNH